MHLVSGNVYAGVAPEGTRAPWIVYHLAGGTYQSSLDGVLCRTGRARVQISVWSRTQAQSTQIMSSVIATLVNPRILAVPLGAPASVHETDTRLFGIRMDFSVVFNLGASDA
ncbi:tail completion protein gp17 [Paraburkholderia caribensis]|uniref:tail completion protein gp17 n=1 Tax=Paraburkholderia caribensis TaxID=75105 RepID=UPI001CC5FE34